MRSVTHLGRLPADLLGLFDSGDFAVPARRYERALKQFERRFGCNLVAYRAGCRAVGGPGRLCSHAYVALLSAAAADRLKELEAILQGVILVAYERPWRFRSPFACPDKLAQLGGEGG